VIAPEDCYGPVPPQDQHDPYVQLDPMVNDWVPR
jgi:hypothetical protein